MQRQKPIEKSVLYKTRALKFLSAGKTLPKKRKSIRVKTKYLIGVLITVLFSILVVSLFVFSSMFDNVVFASQPEYISAATEYSASNNTVFASFTPSFPVYLTRFGGEREEIRTKAVSISKFLENESITLDETSKVNYPIYTVVYPGMDIIIDSFEVEEYQVVSALTYSVKNINVSTIPRGTRQIITKGQNGSVTKTYRKCLKNGVVESEELVSSVVTQNTVNEVAYLGVGGSLLGKDGITYTYSYYIDVVATCYGAADGSGSRTATGTPAREGVIAVDPDVIALGSKCYVTGSYRDLGVCFAEDVGGAIKGNRIDVYLNGTLEQLLQFGRRNMRVYILD